MKKYAPLFLLLALSCSSNEIRSKHSQKNVDSTLQVKNVEDDDYRINEIGTTLKDRFPPPTGFFRKEMPSSSYGQYLRTLGLKPHGSLVKHYDGNEKSPGQVYCAVIDMEISPRDLQQCADAVMRLRGEYLFTQKRYNDIHFNFLSDGKPRYFLKHSKSDTSYSSFRKYMDWVFAFANTRSLKAELNTVDWNEMKIGDVLIQSGNPYGHAVTVVDMVENEEGQKMYMLAQSYMPAQETQILLNPASTGESPWYDLDNEADEIVTPEWRFEKGDLKRFAE